MGQEAFHRLSSVMQLNNTHGRMRSDSRASCPCGRLDCVVMWSCGRLLVRLLGIYAE